MAMPQVQQRSMLWIIFLLAAMVLGPLVMQSRSDPTREFKERLRAQVLQEQLMDAPASPAPREPTTPSPLLP